MSFERKSLHVVVTLDHAEGLLYTKKVRDYESDDDLDQIYKITVRDQGWVNLTADGHIGGDHKSSYTSDSDEEFEHYRNRLHEVSMLQCNMITKLLRCVSSKVRILPCYDGLTNVDKFLDAFEREVLEKHCFQDLDLAL